MAGLVRQYCSSANVLVPETDNDVDSFWNGRLPLEDFTRKIAGTASCPEALNCRVPGFTHICDRARAFAAERENARTLAPDQREGDL